MDFDFLNSRVFDEIAALFDGDILVRKRHLFLGEDPVSTFIHQEAPQQVLAIDQ